MSKWVIGNWKMNGNISMATEFLNTIHNPVLGLDGDLKNVTANITPVICPPFPLLGLFSNYLAQSLFRVGAQNASDRFEGALTGEVSPELLADFNCEYVILGHCERRTHFGETNEMVAAKVTAAQAVGLTPVVCVGETLQQRKNGQTVDVIVTQVIKSLPDTCFATKVLIAYEPVWAIGTGEKAQISDIEMAHQAIKSALKAKFFMDIPVLYGGSVNSQNAAEILNQPFVNGVLVGGASLNPQEFLKIIQ